MTMRGLTARRIPLLVVLLLAMPLFVAACGGSDATPTPTVRFGQFVTAKGVDASQDGAPVNVSNTFSPNEIVYAVVRVENFPQGHRIFARWQIPGQQNEDTAEITANQNYTDTYVEFHIGGESGRQLPTGNYTVQLYVDGNAGPQTTFQVR